MLSIFVQKARTVVRHFLYMYPSYLVGKVICREQMKFIITNANETIQKNLFLYGQFERYTSMLAADLLLTSAKSGEVLDIGANLGSFAIPLAKELENKGIKIYCFECQEAVHQQLCANIYINGLTGFIRAERTPVSDVVTTIDVPIFSLNNENFLGSVSLKHEVIEKRKSITGIAEPCDGDYIKEPMLTTTVDDYCADITVALMKIDVEGMEQEVIRGAIKTITRDRPYILSESWRSNEFKELRDGLITLLESYNYTVFLREDDIIAFPKESMGVELLELAQRRGFYERAE